MFNIKLEKKSYKMSFKVLPVKIQRLNQNHNTRADIKHLLDMPQKQTGYCGNYSMVFTASKV